MQRWGYRLVEEMVFAVLPSGDGMWYTRSPV